MYCPTCGTALPEQAQFCPSCGAKTPEPAQEEIAHEVPAPAADVTLKHARRGRLIAVILVLAVLLVAGGGAAAMMLLVPATRTVTVVSGAYAPVYPDLTATATVPVSDDVAAGNAVTAFYDAINAGDFAALPAMVTPDTKSAVDKGAFEGWSTTTVQIVRTIVDNNVAEVYALESRQSFGSKDLGVKFTVQLMSGRWLINTWAPVDAVTLNGSDTTESASPGAETLSDTSARSIVSALLQARETGDAATIRVLTTAKFQQDNAAAWLDGVDNSPYFTTFAIKTVKRKGSSYVVTVTEQWNSGAETATYVVVQQDGKILVDTWTSK